MTTCPTPYTCPVIDEVIEELVDISRSIEDPVLATRILKLCCGKESQMEQLRRANKELRDWGRILEHRQTVAATVDEPFST